MTQTGIHSLKWHIIGQTTPSVTPISYPKNVCLVLMSRKDKNYPQRWPLDIFFNFNGTLWSDIFWSDNSFYDQLWSIFCPKFVGPVLMSMKKKKWPQKWFNLVWFSILRGPYGVNFFNQTTPSMTSIICPKLVGPVLLLKKGQNVLQKSLFYVTFNFKGTLWSDIFRSDSSFYEILKMAGMP